MNTNIYIKIKANIKNNDLLKNAVTLISGTVIAQLLNIFSSPILSRVFSVEEFGINALYLSILGLVTSYSNLKFDLAIMIPTDNKDAAGLKQLSCISSSLFSVLSFIVLYIIEYSGKRIFNVSIPIIMIIMLSVSIFIQNMVSSYNYWANRQKKYKVLMWYSIINTLVSIIVNLFLGLIRATEYGLIFGNLAGLVASLIYLKINTRSQQYVNQLNELKELFFKYDKFPKYQAPAMLLNTASTQIPVMLISFFFGSSVVGSYSMGYRILQMPLAIIGTSIAQVYYKQAIDKVNNDLPLTELTISIIKKMFILIYIPMAILIGFGDKIFAFVFGTQWAVAGLISSILAPWMLLVFVISPLTNVLIVYKKQKLNMYINLTMLASRIFTISIGALLIRNYMITIVLFGIIGFILWYAMCLYITMLVGINIKRFMRYTLIYFVLLFLPILSLRYIIIGNLF